MSDPLRIGLLAGEASGDALGGGLMKALAGQSRNIEFVGVGGDAMQAQGLLSLADISQLSVNGFVDPLKKLPRLWALYRKLIDDFEQANIDVFIGVDFNVFNFLLEGALRKRGIRTVHYVSPSVYAWRRGRTRRVAKVADMVLCLYPFEPEFYAGLDVRAVYVGHPLADRIDPHAGSETARAQARETLAIPTDATVLAVLPGSRRSEVSLMLPMFLDAAQRFHRANHAITVIPCITPAIEAMVQEALQAFPDLPVTVHQGHATSALTAANIALVKSGTSTLETMLLKRPMVVSYRLGRVTYEIVRRMVRTPYVALPNILAGRMLVPELLQDAASGESLADALIKEWRLAADQDYLQPYDVLHQRLACDADAVAADAVLHFTREGK